MNGLPRPHLLAVSAHEYTHTWLNENVDRELEPHMVEAFCELVAYKLMEQYKFEGQKKGILGNSYTKGRIEELLKADQNYQFDDVITWIKSGADETFSSFDPERLLVIKASTTPVYAYPPAAKTPVPEELTLKGISGSAHRRFALVNDRTMEENELARVRVGTTNVVVRCVEILDRSVLLKLLDSGETIQLWLRE